VPDESPPLCPICGAGEPDLRYQITRFRVLRCVECSQIYLYPLPSPEEIREMFARLYTEGEGSVPELKSYYAYCYDDEPENPLVQLYERWLDELEKHRSPGSLLDVGCGTGLFLSVARRRGWEPFGIDDSEEATQHARDHFGLDVWVGDFADFQAEGAAVGGEHRRFDAITGWDIIEHARRPLEVLEAMRACLAPEGVVALSTPNQRNILDVFAGAAYRLSGGRATWALEKFYIEQHFLYYTPDTLVRSLELAASRWSGRSAS
jgi:SAM-dependent methyltransferase